jgi:hypothetical protein
VSPLWGFALFLMANCYQAYIPMGCLKFYSYEFQNQGF